MHNSTPDRVAFLEQVGFHRVILARELNLEEIRRIRSQTSIELECFIHGALCVCYSGQCYLSYALGGRSGNRGQCAQPCRAEYTLTDHTGRVLAGPSHLLSIKDLNLSDQLEALADAGIVSFKIEGRLKDKAYTVNNVSYYRKKLDLLLARRGWGRSSSGTSDIPFTPNPEKTFNRGFTAYSFAGPTAVLGATGSPKSMGELIGTAQRISARMFTLVGEKAVSNGDGICFFDREGNLRGTLVNRVDNRLVHVNSTDGLAAGTPIYRNLDRQFLKDIERLPPKRTIRIQFSLTESNTGFRLDVEDEDGQRAQFEVPAEKSVADKPEAMQQTIRRQLDRLGNAPFTLSGITLNLSRPWFIPASTLNALRRGALAALSGQRLAARPVLTARLAPNTVPYPEQELTVEGNVLNSSAESFYRRHGAQRIERAAESGLNLRGRRVMTTKYCIRKQLGHCLKDGGGRAARGSLFLVDRAGNRLRLHFDCARCGMDIYLDTRIREPHTPKNN